MARANPQARHNKEVLVLVFPSLPLSTIALPRHVFFAGRFVAKVTEFEDTGEAEIKVQPVNL